MKIDLVKTFQFEAAHTNPLSTQADMRVHGHSYKVEIVASGECDPELGWLVDYADVSAAFEPLLAQLDHQYLNDVEGMEDFSLPGVRQWILDRLRPRLACLKDVQVLVVGDGAFRPVHLRADPRYGTPPRLRFTFEAAHYLPKVPETHKCRRVHGHSFAVEAAAADLDRLKHHLADCYAALDRSYLNEIPGLENATSEMLAKWLWDRLAEGIDDLSVLVIAETCTSRCVYHGE